MIVEVPVRTRLAAAALGVIGALLALSGCTPAAEVAATPSASPPSSSAAPSPAATDPSASASPNPSSTPSPTETEPGALRIDITIAGGEVEPNGKKIKMAVGQKVILNVTSDEDDDIHAHTDSGGYELAVQAGEPAKGSFTIDSPGSYEVESHHLGKIIVILNVR